MNATKLRNTLSGEYLLKVGLLGAAYFVAAKLTLSHVAMSDWSVALVWPASGIALAALTLHGYRLVVGVLLGAALMTNARGPALLVGAAGVSLEALLGAYLLKRAPDFKPSLDRLADITRFLLAAAASAAAGAAVGVTSFCLAGRVRWEAYGSEWWKFWLGDAMGILLIAPVILTWSGKTLLPRPGERKLESAALFGALAVVSQVLSYGWLPQGTEVSALGILLPLGVWAALRFGARGAALSNLIVAFFATLGTATGHGPFLRATVEQGLVSMWSFLGVSSVTGLLLAAVVEQRERAKQALRESQSVFRSFFDSAPMMMGIIELVDDDILLISANATTVKWIGGGAEAIDNRLLSDLGMRREHIQEWIEPCRESERIGRPVRFEYIRQSADGLRWRVATVSHIGRSSAGRPRFSYVADDVTEWKRIEKERERFFTLSWDMLCIVGTDGVLRRWNPALERTLGLSGNELQAVSHLSLFHADDLEQVKAELLKLASGASTVSFEARCPCGDGSSKWVQWSAAPDPDGGLFYAVGRDITHRKNNEKQMRYAVEVARAATRAKSEFLANMSHEIRTPINGIVGMTELALTTELTAEQQEYLEAIELSGHTLLEVVNDILDFSKIEAGKLELESTPFGLRENVGKTVRMFSVRARQKQIELFHEVLPEVPDWLVGDPARLRQILANLISNALKFTEQGSVLVRARLDWLQPEQAVLRFEVSDTGIGIPREKHELIFDAFAQADGSTTRRYGGTGLGLAIAGQLVSRMGGRLWLASEVGRGSTFYFTAAFARELTEVGLDKPAPAGLSALGEGLAKRTKPLHVLLADDNPMNRLVTVRLLEKLGHRVVAASDGREALAAFENGRFDLVLMDVQMPNLNGFEATAAIRQKEKTRGGHVPIVALTAHAAKEDRERCLRAGMDDYLPKPINAQGLLETLERWEGATTGGSDSALNRESIWELVEGDRELLAELVRVFNDDHPRILSEMEEAVARRDPEGVRRAAHRLKGSLLTVGARAASEVALRLERMGREEDLEGVEQAWQDLQREMIRLEPELASLATFRSAIP